MIASLTKINSFEELANQIMEYLNSDKTYKIIGLSGGSTIPPLVGKLKINQLHQEKNHWTWIDERLVSYDDNESNYGSMRSYLDEKFCSPLPEDDDEKKANIYQRKMGVNEGFPQLDLLLLGFGNDGHIASLFPGTEQLERKCTSDQWLFRSKASYYPTERWTWGMGALLKSKQTFIIFKGNNYSEKFKRFFEANNDEKCQTPLARFMRANKYKMKALQIVE